MQKVGLKFPVSHMEAQTYLTFSKKFYGWKFLYDTRWNIKNSAASQLVPLYWQDQVGQNTHNLFFADTSTRNYIFVCV